MRVTVSPYGTWRSPVGAAELVAGAVGLGFPTRAGRRVIWQELRPAEGGRTALVSGGEGEGAVTELLPPEMSARTTVHEYGGRAWGLGGPGGQLLVSSNFTDQRLWDLSAGRPPRPLTPRPSDDRSVRFACPVLSPDGSWVVAIRERHLEQGVVNDLVAIAVNGAPAELRVLAAGHDFYSAPAFSPDGNELVFVCWDHPNMPWDVTQLWRGHFSGGTLSDLEAVAGQGGRESVMQPQWSRDGGLYYISDRTGWWNIYLGDHCIAPMEADFGGPAWTFGNADYAVLEDGTVMATWRSGGRSYLGTVADGRVYPLDLPYTAFAHLSPGGQDEIGGVLAVAGGPARPSEIVRITTDGAVDVLRRSRALTVGEEWISTGEAFSFGTANGERAYAIYYPPVNPDFCAPPGELPPLIVTSHGGPTSNTSSVLDLSTQYWTTRGFAVVDVDYRGSSGYGRSYRQALDGRWGVADVEDCAAAALFLADHGRADTNRIVARGASSSGLTVLAALARHRVFAGGAVRFPVTDLAGLSAGTHKFESRYSDRLVPPGEVEVRSPLAMADRIEVPVLFFHGLDDKVVVPDQSRDMVSALRLAGARALLIEIEGESHGFRRATTVVRAQETELAFYGRVLGFEPEGDLTRAVTDLKEAAAPGGARWPVEAAAGA